LTNPTLIVEVLSASTADFDMWGSSLATVRSRVFMNVSMATDNGANYFNIIAPGKENEAMFVGSSSGNQFEGRCRPAATTRSASI
jgi:hypothetical protein